MFDFEHKYCFFYPLEFFYYIAGKDYKGKREKAFFHFQHHISIMPNLYLPLENFITNHFSCYVDCEFPADVEVMVREPEFFKSYEKPYPATMRFKYYTLIEEYI